MTTSPLDESTASVHTTRGGGTQIVPSSLLGGVGGLVFVALLVIQNAIRSGFPQPNAGTATVTSYYAAHRGASIALASVYPLGALGIVLFVAAVLARVVDGKSRAAGLAGALSAAGIAAGFSVVTATDIALAEYIHRGHVSASVVDALWVLHNATFAVLFVWIGITLAALTAASADIGLLANVWKPAGLVGGICLLVGSANAFSVLSGSPIFIVALLGFIVWAAFLVTMSIRLLRDRNDSLSHSA